MISFSVSLVMYFSYTGVLVWEHLNKMDKYFEGFRLQALRVLVYTHTMRV